MKLNIGCGKIYKEGFVNIDAYDSTIADMIMPANNLIFPSNSIELIESIQLMEHLGLFNAIYALSEWFRVLKPDGVLIIETPNLEKSFKKFLDGKKASDAISFVLGFVQNSFEYKTDSEQFGRQKMMFASETLYYKSSDSEDRSVLFAYLIKNLFGIRAVGLVYPNHFSAFSGVSFINNHSANPIANSSAIFSTISASSSIGITK